MTLGLLGFRQPVGDRLHRFPQRAERAERRVQLEREALVPDLVGREFVRQAELSGGRAVQPIGQAEEHGFAGPAGIGDGRQQPLGAAGRGWRG